LVQLEVDTGAGESLKVDAHFADADQALLTDVAVSENISG
jgi:hypothetical protein